jgi:hypothetical protein
MHMRKSIALVSVSLAMLVTTAFAQPAPREDGKGTLKPGQAVGVRTCRGSVNGINVDATSKKTFGVATCRGELQKAFIEKKKVCEGQAKRTKIEYSWQFGSGENATTGKHFLLCP